VCGEPIPEKRLRAKPEATECVPCLEANGDVPRIKRYDETTEDGTVSTMFTHNAYIERIILKQNTVSPSDETLERISDDDSFLRREQGGRRNTGSEGWSLRNRLGGTIAGRGSYTAEKLDEVKGEAQED